VGRRAGGSHAAAGQGLNRNLPTVWRTGSRCANVTSTERFIAEGQRAGGLRVRRRLAGADVQPVAFGVQHRQAVVKYPVVEKWHVLNLSIYRGLLLNGFHFKPCQPVGLDDPVEMAEPVLVLRNVDNQTSENRPDDLRVGSLDGRKLALSHPGQQVHEALLCLCSATVVRD